MRLAFDDNGPGPVVVLIHGFPLDRSMWSHQRASVGAIYRVITPDLRGHGTTAAPDEGYDIDTLADDVLETLDALQLTGPVVLGGLSLGGYVALSIAARFPERIQALLLINTRAAGDTPEAAEAREALARQVEAAGDARPLVDSILPRLFSRSTFERKPELVARMHDRMVKMPARAVAGTLRGMATRPDRRPLLAGITVPTLVIGGSEDQVVPMAETEAMAEAIPRGTLRVIADAGHLTPVENPHDTSQAILEFLESLW
jgi:pimeloyl-ACP methyl ester carboxylesterase